MKRIESLQMMRGIAAIAVALYHTHIITLEKGFAYSETFSSIAIHGFLGVNFFFILSGFIILMAHSKDIGKPDAIKSYIGKRFIRVYPVYWIFLTLYITAAWFGLGSPDFSWEFNKILSAYTLFPPATDLKLPLQVAWTLLHEILFYCLFIAFIINKKLGVAVFTGWIIVMALPLNTENQWWGRIALYWNVYFIFGMVCYKLTDKMTIKTSLLSLLVGLFLLAIYFFEFKITIGQLVRDYEYLHLLLAPAFSFLVLGAVGIEQNVDMKFNKIWLYLGNASYSIYLVHSAVISVLVIVGKKLSLDTIFPTNLIYLSIFIFSVVAGCIAYSFVESPLLRLLRRRSSSKPSSAAST